MNRRGKYNLTDLLQVINHPKSRKLFTQPPEAAAGPSKATAEVEKVTTQPQLPVKEQKQSETKNTAEVPTMKNDLEIQDASMKTDVLLEPAQKSSAPISENQERTAEHSGLVMEATQSSVEKEPANPGTEEIDKVDPIKKFMSREPSSEILNPVNAATPEAEKAATHLTVEEEPVTEVISETPNMNNDREGADETTEVSERVEKSISPQVPETQEETTGTTGPAQPGRTQPPIEEGAANPKTETIDEVEEIENRVALLGMLPSVIPTSGDASISSNILNWTPDDMTNVLKMMRCLDCNIIPSPNRLFQCPRGHLYCFECGAKRFTKGDKGEISSGTCNHEMDQGSSSLGSESTRGIGYGLIHPSLQLADGEIEELTTDEEAGKAKCCLRIRKSMGDWMYRTVFNNTMWTCPYAKFGCQEKVFGRDIPDHMTTCMKKLGMV